MTIDLWDCVAGWQRKATTWSAPLARVRADYAGIIEALPEIQVTTAYPCATIAEGLPQYFIARLPDGQRFLVDTEGADYARYIVRLRDAEPLEAARQDDEVAYISDSDPDDDEPIDPRR